MLDKRMHKNRGIKMSDIFQKKKKNQNNTIKHARNLRRLTKQNKEIKNKVIIDIGTIFLSVMEYY